MSTGLNMRKLVVTLARTLSRELKTEADWSGSGPLHKPSCLPSWLTPSHPSVLAYILPLSETFPEHPTSEGNHDSLSTTCFPHNTYHNL